MIPEQAFNSTINQFFIEQSHSHAADTIRKIKTFYPNKSNYYLMFDDLTSILGIDISTQIVGDRKTDETIGFLPIIRYRRDNKLNEEPREDYIQGKDSPMPLADCYEHLAKEILYRIMRIPDLGLLSGFHNK